MANANSSYHIPNNADPTKPFTSINIQNSIKLTSINYISWKLQIQAILIGHDLYKYVDGSFRAPPSTITTNHVTQSNPEFAYWTRQDKLLFGALIGTLSHTLVPLVSQADTSQELWDILAKTYAKPSRGHIKQVKDQFYRTTQNDSNITDYMQKLKACADQLASLGKPMDHEDFIDHVLAGLDDKYSSIVDSVNGRDNSISFEELHEKLINKELTILHSQREVAQPATAFAASYLRRTGPECGSGRTKSQHLWISELLITVRL